MPGANKEIDPEDRRVWLPGGVPVSPRLHCMDEKSCGANADPSGLRDVSRAPLVTPEKQLAA